MSTFVRRTGLTSLLASAAFVAVPALAQDAAPAPAPDTAAAVTDDIVITATKRSESLQNVPISVSVLTTKKLDDLNIANFAQYAQMLPSVSFQALGGTPGTNVVYMRGVASGGDGNHSGTLPSVGVYLDEQPVTTIGGNLDVHIYDVARIESLSGPQGTLYGASSEAGTIRIITNKPDLSGTYGRIDLEGNKVSKGGYGGKVEGMINIPLSATIAFRGVGYYERDAGYIDNVPGTRTFDVSAALAPLAAGYTGTITNSAFVKKNYNDTEIAGGRAALKIDLDSNWTVTPSFMYQDTRSHGSYGYDQRVGDLKVQHFFPEFRRDRFWQAGLTIEGKLGNWDLTYAGAYLDRKDYQSTDYTDYAEAYDNLYSSVGGIAGYFYYQNAAGNTIDPRQRVIGSDHFKKMSQEFRVASPSTDRFRIVAGAFYQRQSNFIHQDYQIAGLAPLLSVNGSPGTLWLTQQRRVDKDYAMFGEASFDVTPTLTVTAGGRAFIYDNTLIGFFGFGRNPAFDQLNGGPPPNAAYSTRTGVAGCFTTTGERLRAAQLAGQTNTTLLPAVVAGSPCTNLAIYSGGNLLPVKASGEGVTYRFNVSWKPISGVMAYATWSRGFRPGGINRRNDIPPYAADFLTNYEAGVKTTWLGGKLRFNAAVYRQDWKKFQFAFLGANSFTEIHNGPDARIWGAEFDSSLTLGRLNLTASGSYTDAKTTRNLCLFDDPSFTCTLPSSDGVTNMISAPKGTRLPITPQVKLNGSARYTVPVGNAKVYAQAVGSYQSSAASDIRSAVYETFTGNVISPAAQFGRLKAFETADFSIGAEFGKFTFEVYLQNAFDARGQLSRFVACGSCGQRPYIVPITPQTVGVRLGAKF
ncbi:TonB-dependent receptor [Sphingomonas panacisoli]|uniref:TonB-dependent receptor n=1 Tax=Sphingomonas panacisoli TaxID=1813879 RepID=A0A5B8LJZ8_9SPHN|nr:TonB-dependent receptor [Sphingomonas panacisoli]QDZ07872.1 TonB-dependent receptor [Sphingomonas panacisoli]